MNIIYVSSTMRYEDFAARFQDTSQIPGQQIQKFHRLLIEGFALNQVPVRAVSGIPMNTLNCSQKIYPGERVKGDYSEYIYLPTLNLPLVKNINQMMGTFFQVLRAGKDDVIVCDVLNASISFAATLAAKLRRIACVGIITDFPELLVAHNKKNKASFEKLVYRNINNCSHYILLTKQMDETINSKGKPSVIVEGFCDDEMRGRSKKYTSKIRKCIYAGNLNARYGLKMLVDGFIAAGIPDTELHLYGSGAYVEELLEVCKVHKNIIYHGTVLNNEVVQSELEADLLINPRPTHEEFTKYSFPSKNMEYMASGTAVLTTKLPGMPEEYYPYVYFIEEETASGTACALEYVLGLSREERDAKGGAAKDFVMTQKNNKAQARKILEFLKRIN